jgi:hypothetical protein
MKWERSSPEHVSHAMAAVAQLGFEAYGEVLTCKDLGEVRVSVRKGSWLGSVRLILGSDGKTRTLDAALSIT